MGNSLAGRSSKRAIPLSLPVTATSRLIEVVAADEAERDEFERWVEDALDSLPDELSAAISNLAIVIEDEPPSGMPLLGLYQGVPLTRRGSAYAGVPPDKITIYRGPLERHYGGDRTALESTVRRVVLHEVAHYFGISDERLRELDRY